MRTIKAVLRGMTFQDFAAIAERAERERAANERLAAMRTTRKKTELVERKICVQLGRPEYIYAKNAKHKNKLYQEYLRS